MNHLRNVAFVAAFTAVLPFVHAEETVYWSETPVTCHWVGKVRSGYTSSADYTDGFLPMPQMEYAEWTNQNNWAEGIVPGRFLVMHEDGTGTTNGCENCTAVFDGGCTIACISLYGMVSISNILVTGSTAPRFYFGHWRWDNPHLFFEQGGSFRVTADVPEAPYVIPQIVLRNVTHAGLSLTIENNSPGYFSMGYIGHVVPALSGWLGALNINVEGTGEIRKRSTTYSSSWQPMLVMAQTGGKYVSMTEDGNINGSDRAGYIQDIDTGYVQQMEIPLGRMFKISENPAIATKAGMTLSGGGTFYLDKTGLTPEFRALTGKTLEISPVITRNASAAAAHSGIMIGASGYAGTVRLLGTNTFPGVVSVTSGATLEVPSIGLGDNGSPVGKTGVTLSGNSFLRHTGGGETTDRSLGGAGYGTVIMAGTGDLVWKGPITGGTTFHYTITNESPTARFVCATGTVAKYLNLAKGARLGFAKPDDGDTITVDRLRMAGDASIEVGDGVAVSLAAFERAAGNLSVTLSGSGKLIMPGATEGLADGWITVNGKTAWYAADGSVYALDSIADSRTISAHGDAVPDAPGEAVGITSAGDPADGNDALASSLTRVRVLNQETAEPATVAIASGETLQANLIRVKSGAGDLTIGDAPGIGSVTATEGSFDVLAADASATLTVNAAVAVPAAVPIHAQGAGTNVFAALNGYAGKLSLGGGTVLLTNTVNVTAATLRGTGSVDFAGEAMKLTESGADGVEAEFAAAGPVNLGAMNGKLKMSGVQNLTVGTFEVGGDGGEVVLNGPALTANGVSVDMDDATQPVESIVVGTNGTGILRLESGAVTGRLALAIYDSAKVKGAVYQTGGELACVTKYGETTVMGVHGYAYYGLYGGRYVAAGDWYLANNGEGVLDITGGELWHTPESIHKSRCRLGNWEGQAAVRVSGKGVFNATNVSEAVIMPGYNRANTSSELTVEDGGSAYMPPSKGVQLARGYATAYCHAVINLNGGVFSSYNVTRDRGSVASSTEWPEGTADSKFANAYAFVNCDGGTYRNEGYVDLFGSRTGTAYPPNRVTLFAGGLTIDTNGKDCKLGAGGGLQAPSGQGVASVPWNAATDGKGFVGSPLVRIEGDGKGATAWADFDHETGTVTGIHVTSPGNDYTYANARIVMNKKTIKTIACTLGVVPSGGLTKTGSGTLTVNATNTYTGATTVKKGTLKLGYDDVISSASELVLDGGTLDMNNRSQTFSNIRATANGGSVINGSPLLSGLTIDFDDVLAGDVQTFGMSVAFAPGAKLTVANVGKAVRPPNRYVLATFTGDVDAANLSVADDTLENLPPRWRIAVEGKRVVLRYPVGTMLNFR